MPSAFPDSEACSAAARSGTRAASILSLPWSRRRWRGPAGLQAGQGTGSSSDFHDHRPYAWGDDLRQVNWNAFARSDHLVLKQHRQEAAPALDLAIDASASAFEPLEKGLRTLELAAFAAASAAAAGAHVRGWLVDGPRPRPIAPLALTTGRWPAGLGSGVTTASDLAQVPWRTTALRVVISDLLFPGEPTPLTRALAGSSGASLILAPFSAAEADPPWDGRIEFLDVEGPGRREQWIDRAILERYRAAWHRHFSTWRDAARRSGAALARVAAEPPLLDALHTDALHSGALLPC